MERERKETSLRERHLRRREGVVDMDLGMCHRTMGVVDGEGRPPA